VEFLRGEEELGLFGAQRKRRSWWERPPAEREGLRQEWYQSLGCGVLFVRVTGSSRYNAAQEREAVAWS
jgi:hypothetical protein